MKSPVTHNLSIIAYYLSEYGERAFKALGYKTWTETFERIGFIAEKRNNYLKLRRDEFDVLTSSMRVGWKNRPVANDVKRYYDVLKNIDYSELTTIVKKIMVKPSIRYAIEGLKPLTTNNIEDSAINNADYDDGKYILEVNEVNEESKRPKNKKYKAEPKTIDSDAKTTQLATVIQRDPTVAKQALFNAEYRCELYSNHETFIKRKDDTPYTEPHHLIPMFMQGKVKTPDGKIVNLDVENNIVSLCSNCHNKLHYGKDIKEDLQKLYEERKELLGVCGITVSFDELLAMYSMIE